jgi:formamidopyrimidine-DNA glycosylase
VPELPDLTIYVEALSRRIASARIESVKVTSPFLLRSISPTCDEFAETRVQRVGLLGKRIVIEVEGELFLVLHLMIAGRLHWFEAESEVRARSALLLLKFDSGTLTLTESGSKHRASLHLVRGRRELEAHDPGGVDAAKSTLAEFAAVLQRENHTLKGSLTDPRLFCGIGNAYSDEILHRAGLSPIALSRRLAEADVEKLHRAIAVVLGEWTDRLRAQAEDRFPEGVTAFRPEMAVHGRFGLPCPACGAKVQRIRYAENETNYCPRCQTGGRILKDRSLSRLLHDDWPGSLG